ncbi:protein FAM161B-like isoform X2 [Tachypleus tridentatus]|uniref:protein FAM161B-like isoform X2 n=1 Tax=Tachypleus tridentatus TaxID=6853 RepID=UPI003FD2A97E
MDLKEDVSHDVKPTIKNGLGKSPNFVEEIIENGFKCSSKFELQEVHSSGMKLTSNGQDQLVNVCNNKSLLNTSLPAYKTEVFTQELRDLEKAQSQAVQKIKSIYEDIFGSTPSERSDYNIKYFVCHKEVQTENGCESSKAPIIVEFQTGVNTISTNDKQPTSEFLNNPSSEDNFALNEYDISSFNFPLEWYKALESNECEKNESLQTTCQSAHEQQTTHYLNFQNFPVSRFSIFKHQLHSSRPCHHHFSYQKYHHNNVKTNISKLSNLDKRIQMYRTDTSNIQELRHMPLKTKHKKHNYTYKTTLKPENLWTKKITIPQPFNLTLDEKHGVRISNLSEEKISHGKVKQEPRKLFHANPVPLHTYLPLYEKMVEKYKKKSQERKLNVAEKLKAVVKPLKFLQQCKRCSICKSAPDLLETNSGFRANPPPLHILGEKIDLKMKAEEELRKIRIKLRAEEMIKNSTLPFSSKKFQFTRTVSCMSLPACKQTDDFTDKSKCSNKVKSKSASQVKSSNVAFSSRPKQTIHTSRYTVCQPFHLHSIDMPSRMNRVHEDIKKDEKILKETRWPFKNPRLPVSPTCLPQFSVPAPIKMTAAATLRQQQIRKKIEDTKTAVRREKIKMRDKKRREHQLHKEIGWKFRVNDALLYNQEKLLEKIQSHRESGRTRLREYYRELEEIRERVKNQPLLVERQTMEAAKNQAKQHYFRILQNAGLDPDFVQKKSDKFVEDTSGEPENTHNSMNSMNQHQVSNTSLSHSSSLSSSNHQEDKEEDSKENKYESEKEFSV